MPRQYRSKVDANASERTASQDKVCVSLASFPAQLLGQAAAVELGKRLWGPGEVSLSVGLPRLFEADAPCQWVRAGDIECDLVRVPQDGRSRACLLIPCGDGARWVDRVLGGEGLVGHARTLSEPEAGVLAYALGRALQELVPGYQLAAVERAQPNRIAANLGRGVVWPFALHTPMGTVDLRVLLSAGAATQLAVRGQLSVVLRDRLASPSSLSDLQLGDVLLSDRFPLTLTTDGLVGNVEVRVSGSLEVLPARLEGDALSVATRRHDSPVGDDLLELVIAQQDMSIEELAHLTRGDVIRLSDVPLDPVRVFERGTLRATGSLVVHRGEFGVRVTGLG